MTPPPTSTPIPPTAPQGEPTFLENVVEGAKNAWTAVVGFVASLWQVTDSWINPTPAPTSTPLPPTPVESPTATPPVPTATLLPGGPAATPIPPQRLVVANTGGDGVYVRRDPNRSRSKENLLRLWPEGTLLTPTGESIHGDEWEWYKVRDPAGNVGWVPKQYVREGN